MRCPFATWRPVANHGGAMAAHLGLVLHVQEGDGSLFGFFNNPASQVSAHFWCSKAGQLEQYVDTDVTAWAEAAGNPSYLSVETEGFATEALNAAQLAKVALLLAWAAGVYRFPIAGPVAHGQPGLTPHCNPDGTPDPAWGNHTCPGPTRLAQMPEIVKLATPAPTKGTEMQVAPTPSGDGYWIVSPEGAVITRGDAQYLGGPNTSLVNGKWAGPPNLVPGHTCTGIAAHPSSQGYWITDNAGLIYAYGAAKWAGNAT